VLLAEVLEDSQGVPIDFVVLVLVLPASVLLADEKLVSSVELDDDDSTGVEDGEVVETETRPDDEFDAMSELLALYGVVVLEYKEYEMVSAELGAGGRFVLEEYDALGVGVNSEEADSLVEGIGEEKVLLADEYDTSSVLLVDGGSIRDQVKLKLLTDEYDTSSVELKDDGTDGTEELLNEDEEVGTGVEGTLGTVTVTSTVVGYTRVYEYDTSPVVLEEVDGSKVDGPGIGVSTAVEGSTRPVELAGGGPW
jgi:hypothetical protein